MRRPLLLVPTVLLAASLGACSKSTTETPAAPPTAPAAASAPTDGTEASPATGQYGAPLGQSPAVALADVLSAPEKFAQQTVRTEGYVRKACTKKGCWMEVAATDADDAAAARVTFKDYGFFVPLDAAGSRAELEGTVEVEVIDEGEVEHMEAEGAKFAAKADDGSAREVRLVATGVELTR